MKELLEILVGMLAIAALLWIYLRVTLLMDKLGERLFGPNFRWWRGQKAEIQTLFHGNTKDQDQI